MILMYHHIAPPDAVPREADPLEGWQYYLSPAEFELQLRGLLKRGFKFVPLPELVVRIESDGREPAMTAAISFDDGWIDNFVHAFPVLQSLKLPATFFVTTDHLRNVASDPKRMSITQLRVLAGAGMAIGSHSRSHPNLALLTETAARGEIAGSKRDLESALEIPVMLFAHPFGAHSPMTIRLVREAGYAAACAASGGAMNTRANLFRLYRDSFSPAVDTPADQRALSPFFRRTAGLRQEFGYRLRGLVRPLFRRQHRVG